MNPEEELLQRLNSFSISTPVIGSGDFPVHVVYGGAHLFKANTISKIGSIALKSLESNASDFCDFARAVWLRGAESLPNDRDAIRDMEFRLADRPEEMKATEGDAHFAWTIYNRIYEKLRRRPVEDFRIDFEDGFGIRPDEEEDAECVRVASELVSAVAGMETETRFGFRIKSFQKETRGRSVRTLGLFLREFAERANGRLPAGFCVTLPKVRNPLETEALRKYLDTTETELGLPPESVEIEFMVETPEALENLAEIAEGCGRRLASAHFGAYDYTASLGIAAVHQHLRHDACVYARNRMLEVLAPLGIRLSDSVTTEMPVPIHRYENLSITQIAENRVAVREGWRTHFNNVMHSQIAGFYQSWDLHPAQLVARYAAVYSFYLEAFDEQARRLKRFLESATKALTTGTTFDDLASAEALLSFARRGVAANAFTEDEVLQTTGISAAELKSGSFSSILLSRS
ncbi:MAG: aldolase/citrate lyase family protein [Pyrinomonadaceae bacterium]